MNLVHTVYFSYLQKLRLSHACAFFTCMLFLYQSILPILSNSSWGLRRRLWDLPSLGHEISQGLVHHASTFDGGSLYPKILSAIFQCFGATFTAFFLQRGRDFLHLYQ